jgi:hypothetical protein
MPMKRILSAFLLFGFAGGAYATDIQLTWTAPEVREDGTAIDQIDRFNLYYTVNNIVQEPVQIEASSTSYTLPDVSQGNYTLQISTTEAGLEGERSEPVHVAVSNSKPVKIELTVRVVD